MYMQMQHNWLHCVIYIQYIIHTYMSIDHKSHNIYIHIYTYLWQVPGIITIIIMSYLPCMVSLQVFLGLQGGFLWFFLFRLQGLQSSTRSTWRSVSLPVRTGASQCRTTRHVTWPRHRSYTIIIQLYHKLSKSWGIYRQFSCPSFDQPRVKSKKRKEQRSAQEPLFFGHEATCQSCNLTNHVRKSEIQNGKLSDPETPKCFRSCMSDYILAFPFHINPECFQDLP